MNPLELLFPPKVGETRGGKVYTGREFGWQKPETARQHRLLGSEVLGSMPSKGEVSGNKVYTGADYGWQSLQTARQNRLLGSEVIGASPVKGEIEGNRVYTGPDYGWQSFVTARKNRLVGSEILGDLGYPQQAVPAPAQLPVSSPAAPAQPRRAAVPAPSAAPSAPQLPPPTGSAPVLRGTTPIVRGTRDGVTPGRTQSDRYRQYAPAPLSPLASAYQAESAAGRANMPEVVSGLTFGMEGEKAKAMEAWAKANPMLAYREYNKRYPAGQQTTGSLFAQPQADESLKGVTGFFPGAEPGGFQPGVGNPVVPTEDRRMTGFTQGERMDLGRGVQNLQPFQMAKTTGQGMPAFEVTDAPVSERVRLFLGGASMPTQFKG